MNLEICKRCLGCNKFSIEIGLGYAFIGGDNQRLIERVFLYDEIYMQYCAFDCKTVVDVSFLGVVVNSYFKDIFKLVDDKSEEFFDLTKFSGAKRFRNGADHCPYFLEHQLYDWELEQ